MARTLAAQVAAVRLRFEALRSLKVVVCVESNLDGYAREIYHALGRFAIPNHELLYLDRAAASRRRDDGMGRPQDEAGLLYPGLRTSARFKRVVCEAIATYLLKRQQLHWHRAAVCYAARDADYERQLTHDGRLRDPQAVAQERGLQPQAAADGPVEFRTLADVFEVDQRHHLQRVLVEQFKRMNYKPVPFRHPDGTRDYKYKITGKIRDGDQDDLFMGLAIGILAAIFYYDSVPSSI
jgi:hypothetical protein